MEAFPLVALDSQESVRSFDADGRLHVAKTHLSKAAINPYYGREIPGYEGLGLKPGAVYRMFRPPEELEKAAPTFQRLPILSKHVPISSDALPKELIVGAIGSDTAFNSPYLDASLSVWTDPAIAGIESGQYKELSSAYRYTPVMTSGSWEGKAYDGIMTEINGNHLALVDRGRAGSDVVVADEQPYSMKTRDYTMLMTKKGAAIHAALCGMSKTLAMDAGLGAITANAGGNGWKKEEAARAILALDADVSPETLDKLLDAVIGIDDNEPKSGEELPPVATDEPPAAMEEKKPMGKKEQASSLLKGKIPDELHDAILKLFEEDKPSMEKHAMDRAIRSAIESHKAEINLANSAARDVRRTIGEVDITLKADEIYGMALDHIGVDHTDVVGASALRTLYRAVTSAAIPTSQPKGNPAELYKRFPDLAKLRRR